MKRYNMVLVEMFLRGKYNVPETAQLRHGSGGADTFKMGDPAPYRIVLEFKAGASPYNTAPDRVFILRDEEAESIHRTYERLMERCALCEAKKQVVIGMLKRPATEADAPQCGGVVKPGSTVFFQDVAPCPRCEGTGQPPSRASIAA